MRYLEKYEQYEASAAARSRGALDEDTCRKVACLGKFFAKLSNVLPLQDGDYDQLERAGTSGDMLALAATSMSPANRNSSGFPVLFEAVCGYAKIGPELAGTLMRTLGDLEQQSLEVDDSPGMD